MRTTILTMALAATTLGAAACSAQTQSASQPADQTAYSTQADAMHRGHGRGHHRGAMMMRADTNQDGVITKAEAIAVADARFAKLDTDGDGRVTAAEMQTRRDAMRERMQQRRNARVGKMGDRRLGADGVMTRAEAEARATERFDKMDANHDGKIDKTELANVAQLRHLKHREMRDGGGMPPAHACGRRRRVTRRRAESLPPGSFLGTTPCYSPMIWEISRICCSSTTNARSASRSRSI